MEEKRILLTVSYDGTAYSGWQYQDNGPSIQGELEKALQAATGTFIRVTGASRTDAGVHALGQRAHFDTASSIPPEKFPFVLNRFLPPDIRVTAAIPVPPDFHARFQAAGKLYTYRIHNARHASAIYRNTPGNTSGCIRLRKWCRRLNEKLKFPIWHGQIRSSAFLRSTCSMYFPAS